MVAWKIAKVQPLSASIRYRCLMPLRHLRARGWPSVVLAQDEQIRDWSAVSALIIVKSFEAHDVELAQDAAAAGVPIIIDICDNIFAECAKGSKMERRRQNFIRLAVLSRKIVTVSSVMNDQLRPVLPDGTDFEVIPDQLEAIEDTLAALDTRSWRADPKGLRRPTLRSVKKSLKFGFKSPLRKETMSCSRMPKKAPERQNGRYRLIWFGAFGRFGESGLRSLSAVCPMIARLHERLPIELLVVSNNEDLYRELVAPFPFPQTYLPWHPLRIYDDIQSSDAFIMPNPGDEFGLPKSSARALIALSLGLPVIATVIPSLKPLKQFLFSGDWQNYFNEPALEAFERQTGDLLDKLGYR